MPHSEKNENRIIGSVRTACEIMDALQELDGAGVTELANVVGLTKGTVHTHLATLEQAEYVHKDGEEYALSLKFLNMGEFVKNRVSIYDQTKEYLQDLVEEAGGRAQLVVEEHGLGIVIYITRQPGSVAPPVEVGDRSYLHCISTGKAILAHMPKERVNEILETRGLPRVTEQTITDPDELWDELEEIRERNVAFNDEESLKGLRSVSAPVLNSESEPLGAIGISGTTGGLTDDRFYNELPDLVKNTANLVEINAQIQENTQKPYRK